MWLLESLKGQMELVLHVPWALTAGPDLHSANIFLKGQIVNILGFVDQEAKKSPRSSPLMTGGLAFHCSAGLLPFHAAPRVTAEGPYLRSQPRRKALVGARDPG